MAVLFALLALLTLSVVTVSEGACPSGWSEYAMVPRFCYKILTVKRTYNDQESVCNSKGGHLASIHSTEENAAIRSLIQPSSSSGTYFIGLTDSAAEGVWVYSDSTPYGYVKWDTGEPNNAKEEDCVEIKSSGFWNDRHCSAPLKGICKRAKSCALPFINETVIKLNATKKQHENGSSIDYYCAEGYVMNGSSRAVCLYGDWIPSNIPGCQEAVTQEEVIAGVSLYLVIGVSCLLVFVVIIFIVAYKLKKASKKKMSCNKT